MDGSESFDSVAPGRLCLLGEHQDYLGMPVIAVATPDDALSCRIRVVRRPRGNRLKDGDVLVLRLTYPREYESPLSSFSDCDEHDEATITKEYRIGSISPSSPTQPDFAQAVLYELLEVERWQVTTSADCSSSSTIPMRAGCSSSTAFCVAWVHAVAELAGRRAALTPLDLAKLAHRAEVTHFGAPGGNMDHVTIAVGGLLRIGAGVHRAGHDDDMWSYEKLDDDTKSRGAWVVGYSGEPKDTFKHLHRCKTERLNLLRNRLHRNWSTPPPDDLSESEIRLLDATLTNRKTESDASELLKLKVGNELGPQLGELMNRHHEALRDGLGVSTDRLESMRTAAMQAGAWGYKVVGSGGGGCSVAWTSANNARPVAESMRRAGATDTWILRAPGCGARIELLDQPQMQA